MKCTYIGHGATGSPERLDGASAPGLGPRGTVIYSAGLSQAPRKGGGGYNQLEKGHFFSAL